jgi:deoxyribonuclease-4
MYGSHLSVAGGMQLAISEAVRLGMGCVQVFTKNQQQWAAPALREESVAAWGEAYAGSGLKCSVAHDSYLINLASADPALWEKSVDAFAEEVRRCEVLGIPFLVTHPGAHLGTGEEAGLARVVKGLDEVYRRMPKAKTVTCLEITAGQGSSLGYKLEHLAWIISEAKCGMKLGVCLDTAHLLAAGYDFRGRRYAGFKRELEATVGVERVKVLHLNDSKKDLGTRVDRHDHIGKGYVGLEGFRPIVRDRDWRGVPKILETPKGKDEAGRDWDAINLEALRSLE